MYNLYVHAVEAGANYIVVSTQPILDRAVFL